MTEVAQMTSQTTEQKYPVILEQSDFAGKHQRRIITHSQWLQRGKVGDVRSKPSWIGVEGRLPEEGVRGRAGNCRSQPQALANICKLVHAGKLLLSIHVGWDWIQVGTCLSQRLHLILCIGFKSVMFVPEVASNSLYWIRIG